MYILEFYARQRRAIKQQQRKADCESEVANMCQEWIHHMYDTQVFSSGCTLESCNLDAAFARPPQGTMRT